MMRPGSTFASTSSLLAAAREKLYAAAALQREAVLDGLEAARDLELAKLTREMAGGEERADRRRRREYRRRQREARLEAL